MLIEYPLEQADYLTFQLYSASKSEQIIKSRKKSRLLIPVVYFILSVVLFLFADIISAFVFVAVCLIWYFFYPLYIAKRYVRHFKKHVNENYQNRFGKPVSLKFGDEFIETKDFQSEGKFRIRALVEINEIENYFFLKLSAGESLLIPKGKIAEPAAFHEYISQLAKELGIKHNAELDWKWK